MPTAKTAAIGLAILGMVWWWLSGAAGQRPIGLHVAGAGEKPAMEQAFVQSAACKGCHERAYSEWEWSPHHQSIHTPAFQALLTEYLESSKSQGKGFCFVCHAPHIQAYAEQAPRLVDEVLSGTPVMEGVGCTQCHLMTAVDTITQPAALTFELGRTMFGPYDNPQKTLAHKSKKLDMFQQSDFCLTCHQPSAMLAPLDGDPGLMGDWKAGAAAKAGLSCQTCHMPEGEGESADGQPKRRVAKHAFTGRYGLIRLAGAELEVLPAVQGDRSTVTVIVKSLAPHRLPMTHPGWAALVLDLTIKGKNLTKVYGEQRRYGRRYATPDGGETVFDFAATTILADTTLQPQEKRTEKFVFPTPQETRSFDAEVTLFYAPVSGPPSFLEKVQALSPAGKEDPSFKSVPLARSTTNVRIQ